MATIGVYVGLNCAHCLRVRIRTAKHGTISADFYVGILERGREHVDASELSIGDLDLGDFCKTYDPTTQTYGFQVGLPRPGKFAILVHAPKIEVDGRALFFCQKCDGTGRDGRFLNIPCDGKPYVKVSEVLTKEDERTGRRTMNYECTTVESEEGRLMELERDGDKDLLTLVCSVHFEEDKEVCTVRSKGMGVMRGGAMRGGGGATGSAAAAVQHEVAIHESTSEAKQSTQACRSYAVSEEHRIKFRVYAKTLEKHEVKAEEVGSPPKVRRV